MTRIIAKEFIIILIIAAITLLLVPVLGTLNVKMDTLRYIEITFIFLCFCFA